MHCPLPRAPARLARWSLLAMVCSAQLACSGTDKGVDTVECEAEDWSSDACSDHGIPDSDEGIRMVVCDSCDILWACYGRGTGDMKYTMSRTGFGCQCVDEDGRLWVDVDGVPPGCESLE